MQRKSLGVKKARLFHDAAETSAPPSRSHSSAPPAQSLFASPFLSSLTNGSDHLPLDRLRIAPPAAPSVHTLQPTTAAILNPFAVTRSTTLSAAAAAAPPSTLHRLTRALSKPLCPLFSSTPPIEPSLSLRDKRKRSLSNELHVDHSALRLSTSHSLSTLQKPSTADPTSADGSELADNRHFSYASCSSSFLPSSTASASSSTRKSLPSAPRKKRTQPQRKPKPSCADDSQQPRSFIDITTSPDSSEAPALDALHPIASSSALLPIARLPPQDRLGVLGSGVQLLFSSQGSQEEVTSQPDDAIVYDTSQEPDDGDCLTQEVEPRVQAPPNPLHVPSPFLTFAAPPLHTVTRQPSLLSALVRSSSVASASALSQLDDFCTPLDQPVKERSDEERALDILNARQKLMATSLSSSSSSSCSSAGPPPAPVSVNVFLPYSLRHSPSLDPFPSTLSPSTSRLLTDFLVLRIVGEGSFGCVLQCRHRLDGSLYAVKRSKRVMGGKGGIHELRECWAMSAIMQAGAAPASLLRYHGSWWEDGQLHIATEWCDGPTLAHTLTRPHSDEEVRVMLLQLATALHHLHRLGMAHLDVKPDNILVLAAPLASPPCSPAVYKLVDYGLVHGLSSQPQVLEMIGDRRYMPAYAVEREDECEGVEKVDMWALGLVALEMRLGRRLVDDEREEVKQGRLQVMEGVGGRLGEVLRGMLVVDWWRRMDAEEVVRRLQEEEGREGVEGRGGGVGVGGGGWVRGEGGGVGGRGGGVAGEGGGEREGEGRGQGACVSARAVRAAGAETHAAPADMKVTCRAQLPPLSLPPLPGGPVLALPMAPCHLASERRQ